MKEEIAELAKEQKIRAKAKKRSQWVCRKREETFAISHLWDIHVSHDSKDLDEKVLFIPTSCGQVHKVANKGSKPHSQISTML